MAGGRRPILVDANNVIVRSIMASALSDLQANGTFTGGIYGSLTSLASTLTRFGAKYGPVYAFFDAGVPARRKRLLPGYKQEREDRRQLLDPEDLEAALAQIDECWGLWPMLGVRVLAFKNREADDGLAASVPLLQKPGVRPVVVTSDRDLYQTVSLGADVWDIHRQDWVTPDSFRAVTGTDPWSYLLYRALVGDTSDSIKGVYGCGPKRAAALIDEVAEAHDGTLSPDDWADLEAPDQLDYLCSWIRQKLEKKWRGFERAVLDEQARLHRVLQGIDLRQGFGPTGTLQEALEAPAGLDQMGFVRRAKALKMSSLVGQAPRFLRPFKTALGPA